MDAGGRSDGQCLLCFSTLLDVLVSVVVRRGRRRVSADQGPRVNRLISPYSNTGKRLMAKCRLLYQENEELGRMISSGRLAKLEGDLALQRNFSEEMKKSQSGDPSKHPSPRHSCNGVSCT